MTVCERRVCENVRPAAAKDTFNPSEGLHEPNRSTEEG